MRWISQAGVRMLSSAAGRKYKALFCGREFPGGADMCRERVSPNVWEIHTVQRSDVLEAIKDLRPDVIVPLMYRVGREEILSGVAEGAGARLRVIHQFGAGLEGVDRQCAEEVGVKVMNIPACKTPNAASCAEHAMFLVLCLMRQAPRMNKTLTDKMLGHPIGDTVAGKNVLCLGFGAIGKECAPRFAAFGAHVSAFRKSAWTDADRALVPGETGSMQEDGVAKLVEMASRSDVIIVCTPLDASTRGIVGEEVLNAMPPGGLVINIARGGIVDREALVAALSKGHLGGFGTDVFWREPFDPEDEDQGGVTTLRRLATEGANIILTPHCGGVTIASYSKMAEVFIGNIERMRSNGEFDPGR